MTRYLNWIILILFEMKHINSFDVNMFAEYKVGGPHPCFYER
ncbi:hypothetical protein HNQ42_001581 [Rummeliibacillus stabekisii]|nr:hypothetical protein [Rummeliibacillus stabekisii]